MNGKTEYWGNSYGYDAWGNLTGKTITKCGAELLNAPALVNNQLSGYGYDAAGNMTSDSTDNVTASYDAENRIASASTASGTFTYTYDADGNRVEKSGGGSGTLYWYMTPGIVAESDLTGNLKSEYVFFNGERVARRDFDPSTHAPTGVFYYFSDHLKTASVITDSAGNIKSESDYYPWGGELQFVNNDSNHYKFTGKERDTESGLDYFGARYYSNGLGRFITPDWSAMPEPVPYADLNDPQSLNQYSYVRNIPTTRFDADGHCDLCQKIWNGLTGNGWKTDAQVTEDHRQQMIKDFSKRPDFQKQIKAMKPAEVDKLWKCLNSDSCTQQMVDADKARQQEKAVQPMVPGERVLYRDATGRIHEDIPDYPDPKMSKAELEEQANELRESIKAREINNSAKGGDSTPKGPGHRYRLDQERRYLRQIESKLKGMK